MFNFITKFCLICTSYLGSFANEADADGWVALSPVVKKTIESVENDPEESSIWVYFSKEIGDEQVMVRFPEDPKYRYLSPDEMEITSSHAGGEYSLRVLDRVSEESVEEQIKEVFLQPDISLNEISRTADHVWDISYRKEGKSVFQTFILSSHHLYIFQTEDPIFHRENHEKFVKSLDIIFLKK